MAAVKVTDVVPTASPPRLMEPLPALVDCSVRFVVAVTLADVVMFPLAMTERAPLLAFSDPTFTSVLVLVIEPEAT